MIKDEEFIRIASHMKQRYGIDLYQKKVIVNGRLENYIKRGGWKTFDEFMNAVEHDTTGNQEKMLVNFLTTNHTYFMREFEHFDFFKSQVLPWLRQKEAARKDLRIWCGAASSGEEPYMIAMVLQKAMAGIYSDEQLKNIPEHWRKKFFHKLAGGTQYQVKQELKDEVIFRQFNLMDPFPFRRKMHTIFLRNVMIYFDDKTKRELVQKVYDALEPGGYLFIGTTETIDRNSTPFQIIQPSIFRK